MTIFLLVVTIVCFLLLVLISAVRPMQDEYSLSELKRRARSIAEYKKRLKRQELLHDVRTLIRLISTLLLVTTIILCLVTFGWALGVIAAIVVAVVYSPLAKTRVFSAPATKLYKQCEPQLLVLAEKFPKVFVFLRESPLYDEYQYRKFDSREELTELIEKATGVLSSQERSLMAATLAFRDKTVSETMTPRKDIKAIKKGEFLGPLVLNELHTLGHSRLPVMNGSLDKIVGILNLNDLLSLDEKHSKTAEESMDPKVLYIREDDTLEHALEMFIKKRHHLFIVVNEDQETVGLISLQDVIEVLIGRRLADDSA